MSRSSLIAIAVAMLVALLQGCASISSEADSDSLAFLRTSQSRTARELTEEEAKSYATFAIPFSRVASHVYCEYQLVGDLEKRKPEDCKVFPTLSTTGWVLLYDWHSILSDEEKATGLQFMAFGRAGPKGAGEIIIGFRGTDFTSLSDWRSNLRWFTRVLPLPGRDQYQVVHSHAQQMVDLALAKAHEIIPSMVSFEVYSTGHSLGGGLAQLLAYSDSRVKGAVVFDSSPVTGYSNLVADEQVNCNVRVIRIYERGEALQYVRSVLRHLYNLSANISEISFDLLHARGNPVANHSMPAFRGGLEKRAKIAASSVQEIAAFPGGPDCDCYRDRRREDQSKDAASCRISTGTSEQ